MRIMIIMGNTYYYSRRSGTATSVIPIGQNRPLGQEIAECAEPHSQLVAETAQGVVNMHI